MNWGNKIVVAFVGFAAIIGALVYGSMQQNFELVSADYYKDEIAYQKNIDGSSNANKLSPLVILKAGDHVQINLPVEQQGQPVTGEVWFYCATHAANDVRIPLLFIEKGTMEIKRSLLVNADYLVKTSWQLAGKDFYNEQKMQLP